VSKLLNWSSKACDLSIAGGSIVLNAFWVLKVGCDS
jgi:hypothetical protein